MSSKLQEILDADDKLLANLDEESIHDNIRKRINLGGFLQMTDFEIKCCRALIIYLQSAKFQIGLFGWRIGQQ